MTRSRVGAWASLRPTASSGTARSRASWAKAAARTPTLPSRRAAVRSASTAAPYQGPQRGTASKGRYWTSSTRSGMAGAPQGSSVAAASASAVCAVLPCDLLTATSPSSRAADARSSALRSLKPRRQMPSKSSSRAIQWSASPRMPASSSPEKTSSRSSESAPFAPSASTARRRTAVELSKIAMRRRLSTARSSPAMATSASRTLSDRCACMPFSSGAANSAGRRAGSARSVPRSFAATPNSTPSSKLTSSSAFMSDTASENRRRSAVASSRSTPVSKAPSSASAASTRRRTGGASSSMAKWARSRDPNSAAQRTASTRTDTSSS
mmetsp:Transcript_4470/g.14244  ORF Transcript_4470/g.14244 Transcript_4470/m.14244 type:complete len:325 (+) Transcript_4470:1779-2753(+)